MTTPTLNEGTLSEGEFFRTTDYSLVPSTEVAGYHVLNRSTGQVEGYADQLPQAVMTLLWLQDQYDEIMADPEREFTLRKERSSNAQAASQALIGAKKIAH